MMLDFILKSYYDQIIKPLEKECYRLEAKIYSKKILDILSRPTYKDDLRFYRQLLCDHYKKIGELMTEEELFMDEWVEKHPKL